MCVRGSLWPYKFLHLFCACWGSSSLCAAHWDLIWKERFLMWGRMLPMKRSEEAALPSNAWAPLGMRDDPSDNLCGVWSCFQILHCYQIVSFYFEIPGFYPHCIYLLIPPSTNSSLHLPTCISKRIGLQCFTACCLGMGAKPQSPVVRGPFLSFTSSLVSGSGYFLSLRLGSLLHLSQMQPPQL